MTNTRRPRVIVLANLKGGSGKTTSTAYILHALHRMGKEAIGIDADPQGSLLRWSGIADWPVPVLAFANNRLHSRIWSVVDRARYDVVVIDTPPLEEAHGIVASALRAATDVIVPMAPTTMEVDRVGPVWAAIQDAEEHPDREGSPLPVRVLLNRVHPTASATGMVRDWLTGGSPARLVFASTIPNRVGEDGYGQAFGGPVNGDDAPYGAVATELLESWGTGVLR